MRIVCLVLLLLCGCHTHNGWLRWGAKPKPFPLWSDATPEQRAKGQFQTDQAYLDYARTNKAGMVSP